MLAAAAPDPSTPHPPRRRARTGALATLLVAGLVGAAGAVTVQAQAVAPPPKPTKPTTSVPFSTSFENGAEPAVTASRLYYTADDARTGTNSVLVEGKALSVGGLPTAWYDVTAWVKLPTGQPDTRITWDAGLGSVVSDGEWTQVTGHARADGGAVTLTFDTRCLMTVPQPWGFRVDDVSLVRSKDQFEYPVPQVKCKYPLPYEPVAHTYTFDTVEDVEAWSASGRLARTSLIKTSREGPGSALQVDVAVPGAGARLRGLAPGVYDVEGWVMSNVGMGLVEESLSPLAATRIPGGNVWTPFTWRVDTGEDGSLTFDVSTFCADGFPGVVTTFVLDDVSVVPAKGPVPTPTVKGCPTKSPTPTATSTWSPKPTKTKPTKSPRPTKTKSTKTKSTKTKSTKTKPTKSPKPTASLSTTVSTRTSTSPRPSCLATYRVVEAWSGGFTAELTVTPNVDVRYWTLSWRWPNGQEFREATAVTAEQKGDAVRVTGLGIYPNVRAGQPLVLQFLAAGSAQDSMPLDVALSDIRCIGGL